MRKFLPLILLLWASLANAQTITTPSGGGGGAPTTIANNTTFTGGTDKQVCFNDGGKLSCGDPGLTYTKSTGLLASTLFRATGAGSATAPSLAVGNATTGLYSVSTTGMGLSVNGVLKLDYSISGTNAWTFFGSGVAIYSSGAASQVSTHYLQFFSSGAASTTSYLTSTVDGTLVLAASAGQILNLSFPTNNTFQQGLANAAAAVAQTTRVQSVVAGTADTAGANWTLIGSLSTGSGASGDIIFQTGGTGAGSTSQNTATTALTIKGATQAVIAAGTLSATLGHTTEANILCYNSGTGLITYSTIAESCTVSGLQFKNLLPRQGLNLAGFANLRTDIPWTFKPETGLDDGLIHVGLLAQDVAAMDPRCAVYKDGEVQTYDQRCVLAYLVAAVQQQYTEIEHLKMRIK